MFEAKRAVQLSETDATGALYFTHQLKWAQEAFLDLIDQSGDSLTSIMNEEGIAFPVVHVTADYCKRLCLGDTLLLRLKCEKIGRTSFTLSTSIYRGKELVGQVQIMHVVISQEGKTPCPIHPRLAKLLFPISSECDLA